jgi:hypothetical protein
MEKYHLNFMDIRLQLLNTKKITIKQFLTDVYDLIFNALGKVSKIDKDDMRSRFIEHLLDNYQFLSFENENKFYAYLIKFAKNKHLSDMRQINKHVELDDELSATTNISPNQDLSINQLIANTGLSITELAKQLRLSRRIIYHYIKTNSAPYLVRKNLLKYQAFHNKLAKARELKKIFLKKFGNLTATTFKEIGIDRGSFFRSCKKGITYSYYIRIQSLLKT